MSATVHISSASQWQSILNSSTVVIADFYADWCGPCKMIAPTFESLSTKHSKPNRITFVKVDVDRQQEVARRHGITAMPTFLVFKSGSVIETIRGANPPALTAAVEKAVKLAGAGASGSFSGTGRTLGPEPGSKSATGGAARPARGPVQGSSFDIANIIRVIVTFFGLYFVSLFTLDPLKAAENSRFNVVSPPPRTAPIRVATGTSSGASGSRQPPPRATVRTLADLGSD